MQIPKAVGIVSGDGGGGEGGEGRVLLGGVGRDEWGLEGEERGRGSGRGVVSHLEGDSLAHVSSV